MEKKNLPITFCADVARISSLYENLNTDLKKEYLIKNIETLLEIMKNTIGFKGAFGTGYPFYALDDLKGKLPVIKEQIDYNFLLEQASLKSNRKYWTCGDCMYEKQMPDLKAMCKPCPNMDDELKPRKIINRLPDIDMWMICDDEKTEEAKNNIQNMLRQNNINVSDIDPLKTIKEIKSITIDLLNDKMPTYYLPPDIHIIELSIFKELLKSVPNVILESIQNDIIPFMPIHPHSLRKKWQYDDTAYNFILDYIYSLTPFEFDSDLTYMLNVTKTKISHMCTCKDLEELLDKVSSDAVKRRNKTKKLERNYRKRVKKWKI